MVGHAGQARPSLNPHHIGKVEEGEAGTTSAVAREAMQLIGEKNNKKIIKNKNPQTK